MQPHLRKNRFTCGYHLLQDTERAGVHEILATPVHCLVMPDNLTWHIAEGAACLLADDASVR